MTNEEINWDDILGDIEKKRAVLVMGHDFLPDAQQALYDLFQGNREIGPDKLLHFYQRDGLFLFADDEAKTEAQKQTALYYENVSPPFDTLKKIAEMPFELIVSVNPDISLSFAFTQYCIPHQFDYFSSRPKRDNPSLVKPSAENPLIFNLCGNCEDLESLQLDYDDLFSLLKNLLADNNVPNSQLRFPLSTAKTFILFGFHFDRWYTQLFLRYLNQNDNRFTLGSRNYALKTTFSDEDTRQFFMKQFKVRYIGADEAFFDELYRRFSEKYPGKLRRIVDVLSKTATTVMRLIQKNALADAISMLHTFEAQIDDEYLELLTQTSAMYHQYLQENEEPTVPQEHLNNLLNRVRKNLRDIAKKLA